MLFSGIGKNVNRSLNSICVQGYLELSALYKSVDGPVQSDDEIQSGNLI